MDVSQILNDRELTFLKPKTVEHEVKSTYSAVKQARKTQERDFIGGLDMDDSVRRYYLQGYGSEQSERNPYQGTAIMAFHAWEAGHYDKWGAMMRTLLGAARAGKSTYAQLVMSLGQIRGTSVDFVVCDEVDLLEPMKTLVAKRKEMTTYRRPYMPIRTRIAYVVEQALREKYGKH